jgi:hypothetical protein
LMRWQFFLVLLGPLPILRQLALSGFLSIRSYSNDGPFSALGLKALPITLLPLSLAWLFYPPSEASFVVAAEPVITTFSLLYGESIA